MPCHATPRWAKQYTKQYTMQSYCGLPCFHPFPSEGNLSLGIESLLLFCRGSAGVVPVPCIKPRCACANVSRLLICCHLQDEAAVAPAFDPATRRRLAPKGSPIHGSMPPRGGVKLEPLMEPKVGGRAAPLAGASSGGKALLPGIMSFDQPVPQRIMNNSSSRNASGRQTDGDMLEAHQSDLSSAETKHEATELRKRGVTVRWLLKFLEEIKTEFPGDDEFTTYDLVDCIVVPFGIEHGGMPFALTPGVEARTAECFITHSWELPFRDLVSSIKRHIGSKSAGTAVWIDIFALPPSCLSKTPSRDLPLVSAARLEVVRSLESTLVIMDKQAEVLRQSWCQLEAYTAANTRSLYVAPYVLGRNCAKSISSALKAVDIEQSLALSKAAHSIALQHAGDPQRFNKDLKQHILDALPGMVTLATLRSSASNKNLATEVAGLAGLILRAHGRLEPSAELLTQALNWLEEQHSPLSTKLGPTVNTLAMTRRDLGDLQSAEALYEQAVQIAVENSGNTSDQTVRALLNLAETRKARGAHKTSAEAYQKILKATKGSGLSRRLPAILGLAEALRESHDAPAAAEVLEQGLADVERQAIRDNTSSAALVEMLKAMGLHHKALKDDEAAREYYDRAVAAQRKLMRTPDVRDNSSNLKDAKLELASILNSLAAITRQSNSNLRRAQEIYEEALALRREALPKDHPSVLSSLLHVASIQKRRDLYEQAEATYGEALVLMKEVQGPMHADVASLLSNMADCAREQPEKLDQAEDLYSQALRIRVKALGPDHPDTEKLRNQISKLSQRTASGKYDVSGIRGVFQRSESIAWTSGSNDNMPVVPSGSGRLSALRESSKVWGKKAATRVQQAEWQELLCSKEGS